MDKENEVINGYEIIESMYVGENEVIIAENHNENGDKYLCGYYESNELFARINAICTSNSYPDIVIAFCDNVKEQAEKRKEQIIDGIGVITNDMCAAIDENEKLIGKVIVLKPSVLRREYRYADSQLFYCTGGNGAMPNAIGTKVYGCSSQPEKKCMCAVMTYSERLIKTICLNGQRSVLPIFNEVKRQKTEVNADGYGFPNKNESAFKTF